jgi:hypothetical protein
VIAERVHRFGVEAGSLTGRVHCRPLWSCVERKPK